MALTPPRPVVAWLLPAALVAYTVVAAGRHWWLSAAGGLLVAGLLWRGHPRARFTAYVLLSVVAVRGAVGGAWAVAAFGAAVILALQMPGALAVWPRLRPGAVRGDRITPP